ncbi:MAG: pyruvate formate lyase family protein, partial [Bilophila sp.]
TNLARFLLAVMNGGVDMTSGERVLPACPKFTELQSFDELLNLWHENVKLIAALSVELDNCADIVLEDETPDILCSVLVDDCVPRGKHLKEGGAVYDFISGLQVGIANLADSLAAIKKCVFEDKLITKEELWDAVSTDFAGEKGENIRGILLNKAPKYGNDNDYVDSIIADAYGCFIDEIGQYKNTRFGRGPIGGMYYAGTSSISANVPQGAITMATPDGRKAHEPLAEGCSPSHGSDISGPTSVFQSVSKLPTHKITGGVLLNQKMTKSVFENPRDTDKLISMVRAFFDKLHGFHFTAGVGGTGQGADGSGFCQVRDRAFRVRTVQPERTRAEQNKNEEKPFFQRGEDWHSVILGFVRWCRCQYRAEPLKVKMDWMLCRFWTLQRQDCACVRQGVVLPSTYLFAFLKHVVFVCETRLSCMTNTLWRQV